MGQTNNRRRQNRIRTADIYNAEAAAEQQDTKLLYDVTKEISGRKVQPAQSKIKVHFEKILNNKELTTQTDLSLSYDRRESRSDTLLSRPPELHKIIKAVESLKNNKSPGMGNITAAVLKANPTATEHLLLPLFKRI